MNHVYDEFTERVIKENNKMLEQILADLKEIDAMNKRTLEILKEVHESLK